MILLMLSFTKLALDLTWRLFVVILKILFTPPSRFSFLHSTIFYVRFDSQTNFRLFSTEGIDKYLFVY